ncbi:MAG: 23S rRNA (uracil(1939)-C(5))-methyltransferase RlmD [Candidatus Neomarinimicrobiota bacterium]|nr:MAG: 23S rRNA (uracil(1939)-C(5))-methyltransferase RlmD [Candidatus Neomarinimicrobiota bacterium]
MERPVKKHQEIALNITDLAYGGAGIAHLGDFIIFAKNAVPGQRINARITKVKNSFAEAKVLSVIEEGPEYRKPPCIYFEHCGGCSHQQLDYPAQLTYLHKQVVDLYRHLGQFTSVSVSAPLPALRIYRYRNKMEFAFSDQRWLIENFETEKPENFALGLRAPGNYWKAIDINDCLIAPEETGKVLSIVRDFALQNNLSAHNQKKHTGFLRHLVLRKAANTNQLMINIVTNEDRHNLFPPLVEILKSKFDNLRCVVNTIAKGWSGTTLGESQHLLFGNDHILETLGELTFKISPASFFQTNTVMAEKLYETVHNYAGVSKEDTVWDLYCGTGSIALFLARNSKQVIGFEVVKAAVKDANINAEINGISNTRFIEGDLDKLFQKNPELLKELPAPDILIIDPPRGGMHPKLVKLVAGLLPKTIVYVSCNPTTQVRDIKMLLEQRPYVIEKIQPVDMFPHTPHIEVVTKLTAPDS